MYNQTNTSNELVLVLVEKQDGGCIKQSVVTEDKIKTTSRL